MKKTAKEWFEELPNGLKDSALAQADSTSDQECSSLSIAICVGLTWSSTIEGYEFWDLMHESMYDFCQQK
jgi:hypothetical protein